MAIGNSDWTLNYCEDKQSYFIDLFMYGREAGQGLYSIPLTKEQAKELKEKFDIVEQIERIPF